MLIKVFTLCNRLRLPPARPTDYFPPFLSQRLAVSLICLKNCCVVLKLTERTGEFMDHTKPIPMVQAACKPAYNRYQTGNCLHISSYKRNECIFAGGRNMI